MNNHKVSGVTLIEILLVLVIISSLLIMSGAYLTNKIAEQRREKAVMQMERTLTAGMAYYIDYSQWPGCSKNNGCMLNNEDATDPAHPTLTQAGYIPKGTISLPVGGTGISNPWGGPILYSYPLPSSFSDQKAYIASLSTFLVCIDIPPSSNSVADAQTIAGTLPMGVVTKPSATTDECTIDHIMPTVPCDDTAPCRVVASTTVPGQNLNNARSLNFAGVYKHGACVPAPACPQTMTPAIFVSPVSVSGNDKTGTTGSDMDVFPISSFTAYSVPVSTDPTKSAIPVDPTKMPPCASAFQPPPSPPPPTTVPCEKVPGTAITGGLYWRVCLDVVTENKRISPASDLGVIMAVTRCVPTDEPSGSSFQYFGN